MIGHLNRAILVLLLFLSLCIAGCEEEKSFIIKNAQKPAIEKRMIEYVAMKRLSLVGSSAERGIYTFIEERNRIYGEPNRYFTVRVEQKDADVHVKTITEGYSLDSAYFYTEGFLKELRFNGYTAVIDAA